MLAKRLAVFLIIAAALLCPACAKIDVNATVPDFSLGSRDKTDSQPSEWISKPLIGITPSHSKSKTSLSDAYANAIIESGGLPIILPVVGDKKLAADYALILDGLVLSGGDDLPPLAYGQKPHKLTRTLSSDRYAFEKNLLLAWLSMKKPKPLLGVCRGLQQANVVLGGTLVQDIPSQVSGALVHKSRSSKKAYHDVKVEDDTLLADLIGDVRKSVNSSHHQAADKPGKNLKVSARTSDGVIEAMESSDDDLFILLVQWHPERMDMKHRQAIFNKFIKAAK